MSVGCNKRHPRPDCQSIRDRLHEAEPYKAMKNVNRIKQKNRKIANYVIVAVLHLCVHSALPGFGRQAMNKTRVDCSIYVWIMYQNAYIK